MHLSLYRWTNKSQYVNVCENLIPWKSLQVPWGVAVFPTNMHLSLYRLKSKSENKKCKCYWKLVYKQSLHTFRYQAKQRQWKCVHVLDFFTLEVSSVFPFFCCLWCLSLSCVFLVTFSNRVSRNQFMGQSMLSQSVSPHISGCLE